MKNLKDFREFQQNGLSNLMDSDVLTVSEAAPNFHIGTVKTAENHHETMDPPNILIMRRKSVRQFPNNQRVALYFVDKINKYVTVPYTAMQWSTGGVAEETQNSDEEISENVIEQLYNIAENNITKYIKFDDDSSLKVNEVIANSIISVFEELTDENKNKMASLMQESKDHFSKVVDFAQKNSK